MQRVVQLVDERQQSDAVLVNIEDTALEGAHQTSTLFGSAQAILTANTLNLHLAPQTAAIFELK